MDVGRIHDFILVGWLVWGKLEEMRKGLNFECFSKESCI